MSSNSGRPALSSPIPDEYAVFDNNAAAPKTNAEVSDVLLKAFKYIIYLKEPSKILIDTRAYRALYFIGIKRTHSNYLKYLMDNCQFIEVIVNVLSAYFTDCKAYVSAYHQVDTSDSVNGVEKIYKLQFYCMLQILPTIWNTTNRSTEFIMKFHEYKGTQALLKYLEDEEFVKNCIRFKYSTPTTNLQAGPYFLRALIGSTNNISKVADDIQKDLNDMKATLILLKFAELVKDFNSHRLSAYMAIANMVTDNEIETLPDTKLVVAMFTDLIKIGADAIASKKSVNRTEVAIDNSGKLEKICVVGYENSQYHIVELIQVVYRIAVNDKIKREIYENFNAKEFLNKIILNGNNVEKEYATKLLWQLCFDETIAKKVESDTVIFNYIGELSKDTTIENKKLKDYCKGILWSINKYNEKKESKESKKEKEEAIGKHIMISYNSESRDMCLKIKFELEKIGHIVWIDVENIHGSSLDSMAKAIENSKCILICMTEKYKQSPNCRAEAEYAFKLNKPIVPLILQRNYQPDGWLGIILGSKIYINFTRYSFDECSNRLINEVQSVMNSHGIKNDDNNKEYGKTMVTQLKTGLNIVKAVKKIEDSTANEFNNWTRKDVNDWLDKNSINKDIGKMLAQFDGKMLKQLFYIKSEAPQYFYSTMSDNNKIELSDVVKFTVELSELMQKFQ